MSGGNSFRELGYSSMGESLDSEYGTEVGSYKGMLEGYVEIKVKGSSGVSEKVSRVEMDEGPLAMSADAVEVAVIFAGARSSSQFEVFSGVAGGSLNLILEEICLVGVAGVITEMTE